MNLIIHFLDGSIGRIENVREFSYNYEVPFYSVWYIDEVGRMRKTTFMVDLIKYIEMEKF